MMANAEYGRMRIGGQVVNTKERHRAHAIPQRNGNAHAMSLEYVG